MAVVVVLVVVPIVVVLGLVTLGPVTSNTLVQYLGAATHPMAAGGCSSIFFGGGGSLSLCPRVFDSLH